MAAGLEAVLFMIMVDATGCVTAPASTDNAKSLGSMLVPSRRPTSSLTGTTVK
jgi:hypothetical protein